MSSSLHWLTAEQASEIGQAFDLFDVNRDGFLDTYELKVAVVRSIDSVLCWFGSG